MRQHTTTEVLQFYVEGWHVEPSPVRAIIFLISDLIELHMRIGSGEIDGILNSAKAAAEVRMKGAAT